MATGPNEGVTILDELVCDARPGPRPGWMPSAKGITAPADLDAHYTAMKTAHLRQEFHELIHTWRSGIGGATVTNALSSIARVLKGRGTEIGPCEQYGDPKRCGSW